MNNNNQKLFMDIIRQVGGGHADEYEALSREISKREEKELCGEYVAVIKELGENPLEESKLYDIITRAEKDEISSFEIAAHLLGKEFSAAKDIEQVSLLVRRAMIKVVDFRDENNILKKTKDIEKYEPMTPIDRMKYDNLIIEKSKASDKVKELTEKEINDFVAKATNIDMSKLTTWEQGLFLTILEEEAKDIKNIFLGKK